MMKFNKRSGISSSLFFLVLCVVLVSYQNCAKDPTAVPLQIASKANNQAQAVVSPLASDPMANLKANGSSEITVNVGDLISYTWSSSNADSASSTMIMSPTADSCGNVNGSWVVNTTSGYFQPMAVLECQKGITYTLTLLAKQSASGRTASSQVIIHVNGATTTTAPIASLKANGSSEITVNVGDLVIYTWSSSNADSASSTMSMSPTADSCGNVNGAWVVNTTSGFIPPTAVLECQRGITYTLTLTTRLSSSGRTASSQVIIHVNGPPAPTAPTASLKANGSSEITVNVGDLVIYTWSSSNADSASSTMSMSPTADSCGNVNGAWVVNTTSGSLPPIAVLECQRGITYTLTLIAKQSASGKTASSQLKIHIN